MNDLYDILKEAGYYTKSREEFYTKYGTPGGQTLLHKTLSDAGYYTKDLPSFQAKYFTQQPSTTPEAPQEQEERPSFMGFTFKSDEDKDKPWYLRKIIPTQKANEIFDQGAAAAGGFARTSVESLTSTPLKAIGIGGQFLDRNLLGVEKPIEDYPTYQAGQSIEDVIERNVVRPAGTEGGIAENIGSGFGSAVAIMATGPTGLTKATGSIGSQMLNYAGQLGKLTVSPTGVIAGTMGGVPEFETAKASGASDEEAFRVFALNYGIGQTDAIPLGRMLDRLNKGSGGALLNTLKNMGVGGIEEAIQEGFQTYLTNMVAKDNYDPDRDPTIGIAESMGYGALIGTLLPGIGASVQSISLKTKEKLAQKATLLLADEAIAKNDTGNPETNQQIDEAATLTPTEQQIINNDTVQEQSPAEVSIQPETGVSQEVREGDTQEQVQETSHPVEEKVSISITDEERLKQLQELNPGLINDKGEIVGSEIVSREEVRDPFVKGKYEVIPRDSKNLIKGKEFDFMPSKGLSENQKLVETSMGIDLNENYRERVKEYKSKYGNILDADNARNLSSDYQLNPEEYNTAVHGPSSSFLFRLYNDELRQQPNEEQENKVLFITGGSGVGKSSIKTFSKSNPQIIYNTAFSELQISKNQINRALNAGKDVDIIYIYRNSEDSFKGMIERSKEQGRLVPIDAFVKSHLDSQSTINKIKSEYNENNHVNVKFIDNSGAKGQQKEVSEINFKDVSKEDLTNILISSANNMLKEGKINTKQFEILTSKKPVQETIQFTKREPSELVNEFNESGVLLGATEESKKGQRAAASEQIADFLRDKITTRGEIIDFQDTWNATHPERQITDSEAQAAWNLIGKPRIAPETVTMSVQDALKKQVKDFYRGMDKGVRKGQKLVNEQLIPKVQEALKTANLKPRQTSAILTKLKTANLFTPGSFNKLNTFIDKVVGDAQYAEKLAKGKSLQKRVKKFSRQKAENIPVSYKVLARSFGRINPSEIENLDEYIEKANAVIGAFVPTTAKNYAPVNVSETEDYIDKSIKTQEEEQEKELASEEPQDDSEIRTIAESSSERLDGKDLGMFGEREKKLIENIKKIDLAQMDADQLKRYTKIVDNIVENDDLSGEAFIENIAGVQDFVKTFGELKKSENVKTSELGMWAKTMYNLSNMNKRIFQNDKVEAYFRSFVYGPSLTAGSQTEKALVDASEGFDQNIKKLNKQFNTELRDINNKSDMMVFSLLYQMENEFDMTKMHRNIKQTIARHSEVGNINEAEAWSKSYEPFKNVQTYEDALNIIQRKNPAVYEIWKFFGEDQNSASSLFNDKLADEQATVAKELYNREYVPTTRYTPIVQHDVNTLYRTAATIEEGGQQQTKTKIDPKQARTAKRRTLNLAPNKVYTLEPYTDWILRYGETVYDNKAGKSEARMVELLRHPDFTKLVGGNENATALAQAFERMTSIQRGTNRLIADNEAENFFTEVAKSVRSIGTIKALASASQAIKQSTVTVKTLANLAATGDVDVFGSAVHAVIEMKKTDQNGVKQLLDQSTLVARGLRLGGTDRGTSEAYKLQRSATKTFYKMLESARTRIDKRTRASLSLLVRPDIFNARVAFISYYLQSLKNQGMTDVDLNTEYKRQSEPARQQAMAYAENMVEKTQTASNPAAMSAIQAQTKSKGWEFVKTVFLPFSTFDADFKARMVNEVSALRRNGSGANAVRLAGTVGEALTFAALNAFVLYWYKEGLRTTIAALVGLERPDKEEEKRKKEQRQYFVTSITGALNPLAIGTVPQDTQAKLINEIGFIVDNPENLDKKEWMKKNAIVYEPREGTLLENLGAYSTGLSPLQETLSAIPKFKSLLGEPITITDAYGNEKQILLTPEQQKILILKSMAESLTLAGLTEADVANAIRTVYRESLKDTQSVKSDEVSKPTKKNRKKKRRQFEPVN